jgi:hypothetical protein
VFMPCATASGSPPIEVWPSVSDAVTDRRAWHTRSRPSTTLAGPLVIALPNLAGTFRHNPTSGLTHAQHHGPSHNDREVDRAAGSPINHGEPLIRPGASTTRVHSATHR